MKVFPIIILILLPVCLANAAWLQIPGPTTNDINDIELRNTTYGWLAGDDNTAKFNGSSWSSFPLSGSYDIQGISAVNDNSAWAVAPNGKILKFNGSQWQIVSSPTSQDLNDVYFLTNSNGWIVGNQVLYYYEGISWQAMSFPGSDTFNFQCIFVVQTNNMWIGANNGMIVGFNGSAWIKYQTPSGANITGIWFTAANNGWACSDAGEILHWNGSQWSIISQPNTTPLYGICVPSSALGYAVGNNGRIVEYNGSSWSIYSSPTTQNLNSVYMVTNAIGFIGGDNGVLLQFALIPVEPLSVGNIKAFYH
jgi:photosystem II stability/assembly factor-like uncharacterized protein